MASSKFISHIITSRRRLYMASFVIFPNILWVYRY
uniref:Uncharacterized protein n=1 Tax=Siphoviridae sp. ctNs77 TaxID=2825473 RepID=A0A8S5QHM8_9CAUD|nr:MAG TPA: hypothetical protein [Siphoviridae sp. ctNs77]